jgi:cell wall-associated NlpC family hydrolase
MKMERLVSAAVVGSLLLSGLNGVIASAGVTSGGTWTVQTGDTLYKIAQATGVSVQDIVKANNLANPNLIYPGEVLKIPGLLANQIIATAQKCVGVHYVWGGSNPSVGFDCSGFVYYVFGQNGITLPRVSTDQWKVGTSIPANQLQKGDLVFFTDTYKPGVSHVGIYIGNDQFVEASSGKGQVIIAHLSSPYYSSHYLGAKRVIQ